MRRWPAFLLISFLLVNCGEEKSQKSQKSLDQVAVATGLLFTGTDAKFSSSGLFFLDMTDYKVSKILDGESGDFVVKKDSGRIFLFNRKPGNLNYRELKSTRIDGRVVYKAGKQKSIEAASDYDPHDILVLDDKYFLLANYSGKNVRVVNIEDGKIEQKLDVNWDTGTSEGVKAESFYRVAAESIYVTHQGVDASGFTINDTQAIFRLQWKDGVLAEVDLDSELAGIQGKPLTATFPSGFHKHESGKLIVAGLCSQYYKATCKSGVDEIDPSTNAVTPRTDIDLSEYYQNGSFVQAGNSGVFYGNVQVKKDDDSFSSKVVKFDLGSEFSATEIHTFGDGSGAGYWPSFYNASQQQLFISEQVDGQSGQLVIYEQDTVVKTVKTEAIPASGVFVTDAQGN